MDVPHGLETSIDGNVNEGPVVYTVSYDGGGSCDSEATGAWYRRTAVENSANAHLPVATSRWRSEMAAAAIADNH